MEVGYKIKTFEVKSIVEKLKKVYNSNGSHKLSLVKYALLISESGQERVLQIGKTKLDECEMIYTTFGKWKYKTWNQL